MATKKQDRNEEIKRLRFEEHLKLDEIAARYGISKQRVAIICGYTRHLPREWRSKNTNNVDC